MKRLTIAIVAVLVAAALLLFFGIPANFLLGTLQSRVEQGTGYRLHVDGGAKVGFWPAPSISLRDITLVGGAGSDPQFKAADVRIALSFSALLRGQTHISLVTVSHPLLLVASRREEAAAPAAPPAPVVPATGGANGALVIDRIVVEEGVVSFIGGSGRMEKGIDRVNLDASLAAADRRPSITGSLYWGGQLLQVSFKSQPWPQGLEGQTIPVEFTLQAPGLLPDPLSASAELRERNGALAVNAIAGRIGQDSFDGSLAFDFSAGKPLLKGELAFDRLRFLPAAVGGKRPVDNVQSNPPTRSALTAPWSSRDIDFDGLNFVDVDVKLSANELDLASFRFAPIAATAAVKQGVLQVAFERVGLYDGEANGSLSLDASGATPVHAMHINLEGVNALPLLSDVAGFQSLEGIMAADIDVSATGASEQSVLSSLDGTVVVQLSKGAVRGIDLAKLMHNLTSTILDGWQQNPSDRTPLTDFSAHFRLAKGIASTDDLMLSGPVVRLSGGGSVDIAAKKLQLKVNPQLVIADQGSINSDESTGLGVPVIIEGDWSAPRIYPDVDGILSDPNSVYNQLRAAGKGLFGDRGHSDVPGAGNSTINNLLQGLGNIFNEPATGRSGTPGGGQ